MADVQMLFPMEPREFWQKLKGIVEQVVIQHSKLGPLIGNGEFGHRPLLKPADVFKVLRITKPTLYDWMHQGRLPSIKIESRRYFKWEDVEKLIEDGRSQQSTSSSE